MPFQFLRGFAAIPQGQGIIIDGGADLLRLANPEDLRLEHFLSLLDGTRTADDLARAVGVGRPLVDATLRVLANRGLIEDVMAERSGETSHPTGESLEFMRRFVTVTRRNRDGLDACNRLRDHVVVIIPTDDGRLSELLESLLLKSGLDVVRHVRPSELMSALRGFESRSRTVIHLASSEAADVAGAPLLNSCRATKTDYLRSVFNSAEGYADVGPLFGTVGPCHRCVTSIHTRPIASVCNQPLPPSMHLQAMWVGLLAMELLYEISGVGPGHLRHGFRRFDLLTWRPTDISAFRRLDCRDCRPEREAENCAGHDDPGRIEPAIVFEEIVGARTSVSQTSDLAREKSRVGAVLNQHTKRLPICPQVALEADHTLPDVDALDIITCRQPSKAFTHRGDLSTMLAKAVGIRSRDRNGDAIKRWSASAGNLGSVEAYVWVRRAIDLAPGLYF